jgi:aminoglycoside phosphotransferase (APT) family kinase protein
MNYEQEQFYDQEIEFTYEGKEYVWQGDYSVTNWGEDEITRQHMEKSMFQLIIQQAYHFNDELIDLVIEVKPTPSVLVELEIEIVRNL